MGGELGRRKLKIGSNEQGYLLITTLYILIFSGLFSHSVIKISVHQMVQLNQLSMGYLAKGTLNMGEDLLKNYIEEQDTLPEQGEIKTSNGQITITKTSTNEYKLELKTKEGYSFKKSVIIQLADDVEMETELNEDSLDE